MLTTETFMIGFFVGLLTVSQQPLLDIDLEDIFQNRKSAASWLDRPHQKLGGRTPQQAVHDDQVDLVRHILNEELGYLRDL